MHNSKLFGQQPKLLQKKTYRQGCNKSWSVEDTYCVIQTGYICTAVYNCKKRFVNPFGNQHLLLIKRHFDLNPSHTYKDSLTKLITHSAIQLILTNQNRGQFFLKTTLVANTSIRGFL